VILSDAQGDPVIDLGGAELGVSEDGEAQRVTARPATRETPAAIAIVVDASAAMAGVLLDEARRTVVSTIRSLGPDDRAALVTFSAGVRVAQTLTADKAALLTAAAVLSTEDAATAPAVPPGDGTAGGATDAFGRTAQQRAAVVDAAYRKFLGRPALPEEQAGYEGMSSELIEVTVADSIEAAPLGRHSVGLALARATDVLAPAGAQARRAIVLLTSGRDSGSARAREAALARLRSAGYPAFIIGLVPGLDVGPLEELALASRGGRLLLAPTAAELASLQASLSQLIPGQYVVEYRSPRSDRTDGSVVPLEVTVTRDGSLVASARGTYAVPAAKGAPPVRPAPVAAPVDPRAVLASLTAAAAVLALTLWGVAASRQVAAGARARRRIGSFIAGAGGIDPTMPSRPFSERVLRPILAAAGRPLARVTPGSFFDSARRQLVSAGEPLGLGPVEVLGIRYAVAAVGAALGLLLIVLLGPSLVTVVALLVATAAGFAAPTAALGMAVQSRRRAILRVFPGVLDILAVSLEAGLSLDAAFAHVVRTFDDPLGAELRRVLVEFQMGRPRSQALRDMAERTGLEEMSRFVEAMAQADHLGVPYSRVIQNQAIEIRTKQRQRAEEVARVAPVKMVIPMVLFIFPALFIVVLGPAVPRMFSVFSGPAQ
jgi:tight adherence protein C